MSCSSRRFARLAAWLREQALAPGLVEGPADADAVAQVLEHLDGTETAVLREHTPAGLKGFFQEAELFVGNDSGTTHLAAITGVPTVAVFGPTDPVENVPFPGVPSAVVRKDVDCRCPKRQCLTRACFDAVGVEDVLDAALGLLAAA